MGTTCPAKSHYLKTLFAKQTKQGLYSGIHWWGANVTPTSNHSAKGPQAPSCLCEDLKTQIPEWTHDPGDIPFWSQVPSAVVVRELTLSTEKDSRMQLANLGIHLGWWVSVEILDQAANVIGKNCSDSALQILLAYLSSSVPLGTWGRRDRMGSWALLSMFPSI